MFVLYWDGEHDSTAVEVTVTASIWWYWDTRYFASEWIWGTQCQLEFVEYCIDNFIPLNYS